MGIYFRVGSTRTLGNAGLKLPTWAEWLAAVEFNPGSATAARINGNTASGSASDDVYLNSPGVLTSSLAGAGAGLLSNGVYKTKSRSLRSRRNEQRSGKCWDNGRRHDEW